MNPQLKAHVARKSKIDALKENARALVDATNVMGSDAFVGKGLLKVLGTKQSDSFFFLLEQSLPFLTERMKRMDLRTEDTTKLLSSIEPVIDPDFDQVFAKEFAMALLSNHPTLVQSFFRCLKMGLAFQAGTETPPSESSVERYNESYKRAKQSFSELAQSCYAICPDKQSRISHALANSDVHLSFI